MFSVRSTLPPSSSIPRNGGINEVCLISFAKFFVCSIDKIFFVNWIISAQGIMILYAA